MSFQVKVDLTNPGQFFACCGLLELADRMWGGAEGWFEPNQGAFHLGAKDGGNHEGNELLHALGKCSLSSTLTDHQIVRLKQLLNQKKSTLSERDETEKRLLANLWQQERIYLGQPFCLSIDWWTDDWAHGSKFKTWAGKQLVLELARGMQSVIKNWGAIPVADWLKEAVTDRNLPFYFDSDIGAQSSSRDAGFNLDALGIRSRTRPMLELAAFVGLQRFRPSENRGDQSFCFYIWAKPLPPMLAAAACCGQLPQPDQTSFEFRLLYRTKYLKSFLMAKQRGA
jgi:CRISPR-associated protein Csb3